MTNLPENWIKCTLGDIIRIRNGYAFPKNVFINKENAGGTAVPLIKQTQLSCYTIDLSDCAYVDSKYLREKEEFIISYGDILIGLSGSIMKWCIYDKPFPALQNQRTGCIKKSNKDKNIKYILFYLRHISNDIIEQSKGIGILNISTSTIEKNTFPLPPLAEQGRIVAKIEELFAGIDAGVENLKSVKNQFALYRQSVLKSAFLKVTAWEKLSNICLVIKVGPFGTMLHEADYISNGIPLVNPSQIKNSKILPKQDKCISSQKAEELKEYRLMQGDIVLGRRGEMGRCATVDEMEVGWLCGTGSILIRLKKQMNALFYNFFLASPLNVRYLEDNATGTTMKNLNEKIVANIPVPVPTLAEQERIVAEIESRFERADALETAVDRALKDAEKLKQAVLKKAFSGELVPQNPDDEPASVLLDRIRAERAAEQRANPKKGKQKR